MGFDFRRKWNGERVGCPGSPPLELAGGKGFCGGQLRGDPRGVDRKRTLRAREGLFYRGHDQAQGKFDLANEGTIFLDEIADMSLKTQAKILRILQEQKFERVGGTEMIFVDVRVIAATNRDLKEEIEKGRFREDLYYRLNVIPMAVPPLRERKADIAILVEHFISEFCLDNHKEMKRISPGAMDLLLFLLLAGQCSGIEECGRAHGDHDAGSRDRSQGRARPDPGAPQGPAGIFFLGVSPVERCPEGV